MTPARINLRTLDMLRGMLAVYVLLGHARWLLWAGHTTWMAAPHAGWLEPVVYASASLRYGREAVMIFFVLSGFFIHLRAAGDAQTDVSATSFYRRRAHRLAAPYAFALVVTVALDLIGRAAFPVLYQAATGDALIDGVFSRTGFGAQSVAPALVMLPSSRGWDFGTNGPLWSLAYEVVYYALYPLWLSVRRTSAVTAFAVVPIACVAIALLTPPTFIGVVLLQYPVWLTGAALAEGMNRGVIRVPLPGAVALFAVGFLLHVGGASMLTPVPAMLYGGAAVLVFATLNPAWSNRLPVRIFEYLGVRSYSIYIVHFPMIVMLSAAAFAWGGRPFHGWFAAGGALLAIGFGCLCFELCERHFVHHREPASMAAA